MNIVWYSVAPFAPTGYGQQTAIWTQRFRDAGHNIAISATNGLQYASMDWNGIRVYPMDRTNLNKRMLRHHVADWAAECGCSPDEVQVISLWDVWPWVDPQYGGIVADFKGLNIAAWTPVDSDPITPKSVVALNAFDVTPIAMSRFGERKLREAGFDPLYVPHGIDTSVYKPHDDRAACKRMIGAPEDAFVVGMVANNQGLQPARKAFPNVLQAFSVFREAHDDAILYLHSDVASHDGLNLLGLAEMMGVPPEALRAVPQIRYQWGNIAQPQMAQTYSAFDVLANPSYGEGFGLPIVESQACGTPVIVTEFSSMPELVGGGWTVGGLPWYNESSGAYWMQPDTGEILAALEQAYEQRGDQDLRERARAFALQYDADTVMAEHWVPVLEQLGKPREVPPLPTLNRDQRRDLMKDKAAA